MNLLLIFLGGVLVNNFVMYKFLGICPFLGVSNKIETSFGMGVAVTFVMAISAAICNAVYYLLLKPFHIEYLYNISFILIISSLVQLIEMVLRKKSPGLYNALGVYLPLITTNCAVLGVVVLNVNEGYGFALSIFNAISVAIGFTLAIVLFAGIRTRTRFNNYPAPFQGLPITMIAAGLMSIAFLGFQGLI